MVDPPSPEALWRTGSRELMVFLRFSVDLFLVFIFCWADGQVLTGHHGAVPRQAPAILPGWRAGATPAHRGAVTRQHLPLCKEGQGSKFSIASGFPSKTLILRQMHPLASTAFAKSAMTVKIVDG